MQLQSTLLVVCISAALLTTNAHAAQPDERIVVKFRADSFARMQPQVAVRSLAANAQPVSTMANGAQVISVRAGDADATLRTFAAHPDVQYAVRDALAQPFRLVNPCQVRRPSTSGAETLEHRRALLPFDEETG